MEYCGRRTPRSRVGPLAGRRRGSTSTHYINDRVHRICCHLHGQSRHRARLRRDRRSARDQEREPVQDPRVSQRRRDDRASSRPVAALAPAERLGLPGIGKDLAAKIGELVETGSDRLSPGAAPGVPADDPRPAAPAGRRPEDGRAALPRARTSARSRSSKRAARDGRIRAAQGHGREEGGADPQGARGAARGSPDGG